MSPATHPAPEDLLSQLGAVRSLVVSLLGDEHAADDVLQEVWLASAAKRPTHTSSTWAWLRGLARIEVLRRRRADRRREARERAVARPEAALAPEHASDRIELARRVLEEVQTLEAPYGPAIWLHYFEGLAPREIAQRAGVPSETARTWLHRARQKLRERLEARYGRGDAWRAALAPLASPLALGVSGAASLATLTTAVSLMNAKVLGFTAAAIAVLATGWFVWPSRDSNPAPAHDTLLASPRVERADTEHEPRRDEVARATLVDENSVRDAAASTSPPKGPGVLVLDAAGAAVAGIPVAVISRKYDQETQIWEGRTSEDGMAPFPSDWRARVPEHLKDQIAATLRFPVSDPVDAAIDLAAEFDAPLVLRMPPTGSVEISVVDEQGRLASEVPQVIVSGTSAADVASGRTHWQSLLTTYVDLDGGRGVLPHVGLGCRLQMGVYYPGGARARVDRYFDGPTKIGERVEARVHMGELVPILFGRLRDEQGGLLAKTNYGVVVSEFHGAIEVRSSICTLQTDGEGRFRYAAWAWQAPIRDGRTELEFRGTEALAETRATVQLGELAPGEVDLGDVVLRLPSVLVSGLVRVGDGPPKVDVSVSIELEPVDPQQGREHASAQLNAEGRFALRRVGSWRSASVVAAMEGGWPRSKARVVVPGSPEALALELVLPPISSVRGSLICDEGYAGTKLWLHAVSEQSEIFAQWVHAEQKEFRFELPSGTYRILLDATGRRIHYAAEIDRGISPLIDIADFRVGNEEITRDPRLQSIDLRGRFRTLRVLVLDENGDPIRRSGASDPVGRGRDMRLAPLVPNGPASAYDVETDREGRFEVACLREHGSFLLSYGGYAPSTLAWAAEEQVVRLGGGILVELELAPDAPVVNAPFELVAALSADRLSSPDFATAIGNTELWYSMQGGRCTLRVPCAGSYRVEWRLRVHHGETSSFENASDGDGSTVVEISDTASPPKLVVAPRAEAVERAKARALENR